jgi:hypothetical protein
MTPELKRDIETAAMTICACIVAAVIMLFLSQPAKASNNCHSNECPPVTSHNSKPNWQLPVFLLVVGGVACILYCDDVPKTEPLPDTGPVLKVTPDNLKDKPRKFLIEAE